MVFTISSSKSIFGIVVISSSSFSSYLPLLNIWDWLADWMDCCWTSASLIGWVAAASLCAVYFSSYLALSRSQSFGLLCLPLAMLFSCLLLALLYCLLLALLFSVLFIVSLLLDD